MRRVLRIAAVAGALLTWTAPHPAAGQRTAVPSSEAEWGQLRARLEANPYYLASLDRDDAVRILVRAIETRLDWDRWAAYGPGVCAVRGPQRLDPDADVRRTAFEWSRECLDRVLEAVPRPAETLEARTVRSMITEPLAEALVEVGELDRADSLAAGELRRTSRSDSVAMRGNVLYAMNQVRGRVALHRGDRPVALEYLRLAGSTEGSPQLNTFGPNLVLARELLELGEREAVREFLADVGRFWRGPQAAAELAAALEDIDRGDIPGGIRWR